MADRNCSQTGSGRDSVCVDVNRIFDSCRDKDCFENTRVFLTESGQDIIDKTTNVRVKCAHVVWTQLTVEPVQFNRGFYQVIVRFYVRCVFEGCVYPGKPQEFEGIAACEKKVILFGSEGCVSIFRSEPGAAGFCGVPNNGQRGTNLPVAVCEVADPVVLDIDICEKKRPHEFFCCCGVDEIPENVCGCTNGSLTDPYDDGKLLFATLGFFSVIRIERPCQFIINATEYSVPDKECITPEENDPCALFRKMAFPVSEFSPPSYRQLGGREC
jgi:hypothetical protein